MITTIGLVIATTLTALHAGLYYAFSCAVMPGLRRVDDATFVATMRSINRAILNPWFAVSFFGSGIVSALVAVSAFVTGHNGRWWLLAAVVLHVVSFVVTVVANIPRNEELDSSQEPAAVIRKRFVQPWVRWNNVRGVVAGAALLCLAAALLVT